MKTRHLLAAALLATLGAGAFAQNQTPVADARQERQQERIQQGVASGQLTKREARRLEHQQARIATAEAEAKADGKVTKAERAKLHHMQDHASHDIAHQKHDRQKRRPASAPAQ